VTNAMKEHNENEQVQRSACTVVSGLALLANKELYRNLVTSNFCELLSDVLVMHKDQIQTMQSACRCASNLALSADKNRNLKHALVESEILELVLKAARCNKEYKLQEVVAWCVWGLLTNCKSSCTSEEVSAIVSVLTKALRANPTRARLNQSSFWALSCMIVNFPKSREAAFNSTLPMISVQSLQTFCENERVILPVLWFLHHVLNESDIGFVKTVAGLGAASLVLKVMKKHLDSPQIIEPAIYLMGTLAPVLSGDLVNESILSGAILKAFSLNIQVINVGLAGTFFVSKVSGILKAEIVQRGVLNLLEESIQIHFEDPLYGFRALEALANIGSAENALELIELVVSLMAHFEHDGAIQEKGIDTLIFIIRSFADDMYFDSGTGTFLASVGCSAIKAQGKNLKTQENAAELLYLLLRMFDSATFQFLVDDGVQDLIVRSMKRFPKANKLQYHCSRALGEVFKNDDGAGAEALNGGAVECLVFAIKKGNNNRMCREAACSALCSLIASASKSERELLVKKNLKNVLSEMKEQNLSSSAEKDIDIALGQLSSWSDYFLPW